MLYELQKIKFPEQKWRQLANSLKVGSAADNIDDNHRNSTGKLQAVVRHWMDNTTQHNQWITLVQAVSMCDECHKARQLATAVGVEYNPSPPPSTPTPLLPSISEHDELEVYLCVYNIMPQCMHLRQRHKV